MQIKSSGTKVNDDAMARQPESASADPTATLDLPALIERRRKNLEAVLGLNRLMADIVERCARQQIDCWSRMMTGAVDSTRRLALPRDPGDAGRALDDFVSEVVGLAGTHLREFSELTAAANSRAFGIVTEQIFDALAEASATFSVAPTGKAPSRAS